MTDRFCAFVAPDYPWTKRNSVKFKDLAGPPLILPVRESSIRMHIEAAADKNKISLPAAYEAVYNSTITAMAAQGLGVAILSELVVRGDDTTRLRRIAIEDPPLYRYIGILRRAGRSLSRPAELLIGALREAASAD
jgi:DNA-binding transcriptional LysR family regulator